MRWDSTSRTRGHDNAERNSRYALITGAILPSGLQSSKILHASRYPIRFLTNRFLKRSLPGHPKLDYRRSLKRNAGNKIEHSQAALPRRSAMHRITHFVRYTFYYEILYMETRRKMCEMFHHLFIAFASAQRIDGVQASAHLRVSRPGYRLREQPHRQSFVVFDAKCDSALFQVRDDSRDLFFQLD